MTNKKTVLITGANKGLGFETAKKLAALDYFIFIGSRDKEKGLEAAQELKALGFSDVDTLEIDVTNKQSVERAKAELEGKITKLDVLINNAGVVGEQPQNASEIALQNVRDVFETNFFGVIQVTQNFINLLKKSDEPRIVNVTSDLGSLTNHKDPNYRFYEAKVTAYCSSKTALNAYTVMLAHEFKDDKRFKINAVNPGFTATDFNHNTGTQTKDEGTIAIVKYATIGADGPTGGYFEKEGEIAW